MSKETIKVMETYEFKDIRSDSILLIVQMVHMTKETMEAIILTLIDQYDVAFDNIAVFKEITKAEHQRIY